MRHRLIAAVLPMLVLLGACGPTSSTDTLSHPSAAYRLFIQQGFSGGSNEIAVVNSATGSIAQRLPLGTPAPDWSRLYVVDRDISSNTIRAIEPRSGRTVARLQVPPGFFLPDLNGIGPTAGISPNGRWLVLSRQLLDLHGTTTSFLLVDSSLSRPSTRADLAGDFTFDALSNDGSSLYLIQKMGDANHYQVRLYDVAKHSMWPNAIVDKREPNEPMNGTRGPSIAAPTGEHVYTVYLRDHGPFIHALGLSDPFAFCVDLPSKSASNWQQMLWSLAVSADGSRLYAVNASLRTVSVFTTGEPPTLIRTASLPAAQVSVLSSFATTADAKGQVFGGAALSADAKTLFAVGETGLLPIDTQTLQSGSLWLKDYRLESIRMSSDGAWLFAASPDPARLFQVNPSSGAIAAEVPGVDSPWAVLWAEPEG